MALIALAPWLGGRIALGLGSGRFATAEYTLEPAHEPTGFLFRLGQRLRPALGLRLRWAGLGAAVVPARLATFAALAGRLECPPFVRPWRRTLGGGRRSLRRRR